MRAIAKTLFQISAEHIRNMAKFQETKKNTSVKTRKKNPNPKFMNDSID